MKILFQGVKEANSIFVKQTPMDTSLQSYTYKKNNVK